jgi:hypothetical protein
MKTTFQTLIFLISIFTYAQTKFEKGYFIDNSSQKIECFIKNEDWKNNPTSFKYKTSDQSDVLSGDIMTVKEFGVYDSFKYIKADVKIDKSTEVISQLSRYRDPKFVTNTVFLKNLVEGSANLYLYEEGNLRRYFFNMQGGQIEPLIYKKYSPNQSYIMENNHYKQQLFNSFDCESISQSNLNSLKYTKNSLVKMFVKYNTCKDANYSDKHVKLEKNIWNVSIRPRVKNVSLEMENSVLSNTFNFDDEIGFGLGVEVEYILPFNNNKWGIIAEPTFSHYKADGTYTSTGLSGATTNSIDVKYSTLEIPVGLRHYFFLSDTSTIFANVSYVINLDLSSEITLQGGNTLDISNRSNAAIGLGYKHNNKYSIELRYQFEREILSDYVNWTTKYSSIGLVFGYTIF